MTRIVLNDRAKYGNRRVQLDGYTFDSAAEAHRYQELRLMEAAGEIRDIQVHRRFPLSFDGHRIGYYVADFDYLRAPGTWVVEDVKGVRTAIFAWKAKHFALQYGTRITEVSV